MEAEVLSPSELTERQKHTLELIIKHYIETGHPVSSKSLVSLLGVSSATIRNDMGVLEETGYISSPHTSAGRVPTEKGYRYFVQHLLDDDQLTAVERRTIAHQFHQAPLDLEQWMRLAAAVLSRTARSASLVTAPYSKINRFKHLELIATQGRMVLMVLVLHNGEVRQRMLTLAEPISQERLSETAARLTQLALGLTAQQLRAKLYGLNALEEEVLSLVITLIEQESDRPQLVYRDGLAELLSRFGESEGAQQALRVLEEQTLLEDLINEANPSIGNIRVLIAGEGRWDNISLLSIVLGRYGVAGQATGTLGVLGPTRMSYGRAISAVRYMSDLMSTLMVGIYGGDTESSGA
ncbi:MAG: heat-inducible transcription repressor HrcA [Anaerolineae bacterium]|nr:heat-inducible transcription repressor HrcA [Anaerolineae bacterium]